MCINIKCSLYSAMFNIFCRYKNVCVIISTKIGGLENNSFNRLELNRKYTQRIIIY